MVSIIILNYHVKKELFACLESLYDSKPKTAFEIILVDNDEKKTIEKALKKQFPKVRYIKNENKGFGQGNNVGARHAKGEYLFFLNPDTIISKETIDVLGSYLQTHKKVGIVAPLLYNMDGSIVPLQGARELTPTRAIFSFSFINKFFPKNTITKQYWYLDEWDKKSVKEVESIPGTAFVIRREIYEKIQGFDETFFLYFEEQDLCKRVKELGWGIVMHPKAHVSHVLGSSTKHVKRDVSKIFQQSRFYYLKKHFGLLKALCAEFILRINKYSVLLGSLIALGLFLRLVNIANAMFFIGDQGWFYLSAREMVVHGEFPLVGIVSSHSWLHQGAFWTYILGGGFWLFGFHPVMPAYMSTGIDLLAIIFIYKLGSLMFSRRLGVIAAAFYATSPLIIANARMPYHTSPIPLFIILALYCLYQWIQGKISYFPLLIALLAVLYNFELATFLLSIVVLIIGVFGLLRRKKWAKDVFNKKILLLAVGGWFIVMLPMLVYDVSHGFPQTLKLLAWVGYRVLVFFGYPQINPISPVSLGDMTNFVIASYQQLIVSSNGFLALLIFIAGFLFLLSQIVKQRNKTAFVLLGVVNLFLLAGLFVAKTPSDAYLPMIFPGLILLVAVLFDGIIGSRKRLIQAVGVMVMIGVLFVNSVSVFQKNMVSTSFSQRLEAATFIVKEAGEKEYNLKGQGAASEFESFTMNYEYLTWWLGHGPSQTPEKLQFVIQETQGKIFVEKQE